MNPGEVYFGTALAILQSVILIGAGGYKLGEYRQRLDEVSKTIDKIQQDIERIEAKIFNGH